MTKRNLLSLKEQKTYQNLIEEQLLTAQQMGNRTISPSALIMLLGCELRFFFQYVKNWRIAIKAAPLALGSSFHAAAEHLNRETALGRKVKTQDLFDVYDITWEEETNGVEFKSLNEKASNREMGLKLIEKYLNSNRRKQFSPTLHRAEHDPTALIPAVEMEMSFPFIDLDTGEVLKDGWYIRGFIDVIKKANKDIPTNGIHKGDLFVADYKTARSEYTDLMVKLNLQILMYAYGIRYMMAQIPDMFPGHKNKKEDWVGIICLIKRKDPAVKHILVKVTDEEIRYLQDLVLKALNRVEAGIFLPTGLCNPTMNCTYCEFKEPCQGLRVGENPEEWWAKNKSRSFYRNKRS